jgi:hypothetical protein
MDSKLGAGQLLSGKLMSLVSDGGLFDVTQALSGRGDYSEASSS